MLSGESSPATAMTKPNQTSHRGSKPVKYEVSDTPAARSPKQTANPVPPKRKVRKCTNLVVGNDAATSFTDRVQDSSPETSSANDAVTPPYQAMFVPAARTPR